MSQHMSQQTRRTLQETTTSLAAADVLAHAARFFIRQNGIYSAFVDREGPNFVTLRGQGGEELAIGVAPGQGGTRVTASSYLFDQQIARFFNTLPAPDGSGTAALPLELPQSAGGRQ